MNNSLNHDFNKIYKMNKINFLCYFVNLCGKKQNHKVTQRLFTKAHKGICGHLFNLRYLRAKKNPVNLENLTKIVVQTKTHVSRHCERSEAIQNKKVKSCKLTPAGMVSGVLLLTLFTCCSPRISEVGLKVYYLKPEYLTGETVADSTISMNIWANTYRGLFRGRESFLNFGYNSYFIVFNKIDTLYTETDIKYFRVELYDGIDTVFTPQYCKLQIKTHSKNSIYVDFDIQDTILPNTLKGKYKLKFLFSNRNPQSETMYEYYEK